MENLAYSEAFLQKRKFYTFLPLLALPFLTFIYWVVVVKNIDHKDSGHGDFQGLQLTLPSASLKGDQGMDKLAFYKKADQDSASWAQQIKKDPYRWQENLTAVDSANSALMGLGAPGGKPPRNAATPLSTGGHEQNDALVHQKLASLNKALTNSQKPVFEQEAAPPSPEQTEKPSIAKLEKMMNELGNESLLESEDPEMAKLDSMLDKLLAIQNPRKNQGQSAEDSPVDITKAITVSTSQSDQIVSLLAPQAQDSSGNTVLQASQTGFYGLEEELPAKPVEGISAVIEKTQELVSGATVQLRLIRPIYISAGSEPVSGFIYGIASLSGERLKIKISSIRTGQQVLPVNLKVYDLDGIEGIYIPGALSRTVTKQALGSQVQGYDIDIGGFSAGAQAASAGIQMGKMLLGRKTRLTQVTLRQGYKVLLKDANSSNP